MNVLQIGGVSKLKGNGVHMALIMDASKNNP